MAEHGSSIKQYETKAEENKKLADELKEENKALEEKAKDYDDLSNRVTALQGSNEKLQEEVSDYKSQVAKSELDKRIIKSVPDAYNPDDIFNYVNTDNFEKDEEGNITNFDDVINQVREEKFYLFKSDNNPSGNNGSGDGDEGNDDKHKQFQYKTNGGKGNAKGEVDYSELGKQMAEEFSK